MLTQDSVVKGRYGGARPSSRAPGFDGLRALAVLAVMTFHERFGAVPGGFLGVDVFFVLSGYLITDLLAAHWARYGRLDLRIFWIRRARRLFPALAVVLVTATAAAAVVEPDQLGQLRPALVAAITYASNWWQAWQHQSYFTMLGPPPVLQHLWSLAIEEQFYLAWPLILGVVLLVCRRRRTRAVIAWVGAAASALAMAAIYTPGTDPSRVYYGTDTHATALLTGCALALTWPLGTLATATGDKARRLDIAGMAGLAVLAWAVGHFSGSDIVLYPVGLVVVALASAAIVAAAASDGAVGAMLGWSPLRWLGVRSYGIYLWHWPVIALADAATGQSPGNVWTWAAETAAAIGLAAASWRWVETPILRNGFRATARSCYAVLVSSVTGARRSPLRTVPALAAITALTVACTAGYRVLNAPASTPLQAQIALGKKISAATRVSTTAGAGAAAAAGMADHARSRGRRSAVGWNVSGSRVTAIGDSVMLAAAPQLRSALRGIYIDARVSRQMSGGLQTVANLARARLLRAIVVVGLGTNGPITSEQIHQLLTEVGPHREVVLVNTFVPRPWEGQVDRVLAAAARSDSNVVLANWWRAIENRTNLLWDDHVHPRPTGGWLYAHVIEAAITAA